MLFLSLRYTRVRGPVSLPLEICGAQATVAADEVAVVVTMSAYFSRAPSSLHHLPHSYWHVGSDSAISLTDITDLLLTKCGKLQCYSMRSA